MKFLEKIVSNVFSEEFVAGAIVKAMDIKDDTDKSKELKKEVRKLKDELEELKLTKKIELRDIEHMVKVKEEKNAIEYEHKEVELEKKYQNKEITLLETHHQKALELIEKGAKNLQDIYQKIIDRLPNVNMEIRRKDG